jgi:hypothetical protein
MLSGIVCTMFSGVGGGDGTCSVGEPGVSLGSAWSTTCLWYVEVVVNM